MESDASVERVVPNGPIPRARGRATARPQLLGRARAAQLGANRLTHRGLQRGLMPALRTRAQMRIDSGPLVGGCLAVDVRRKQRVDFPATRHWCCL